MSTIGVPPDQLDLERCVGFLEDLVADLDDHVRHIDPDDELDLARAVEAYRNLVVLRAALAVTEQDFANAIGKRLTEEQTTIEGVGVVVRHSKMRRTNWQSEDLLRAVLNHPRCADPETGEIPSDLDMIRQVFPLAGYNARIGALKALDIDPDEFAETEWAGYSLEVKGTSA